MPHEGGAKRVLNTQVKVLSLSCGKVMRVQRPKRIRLLGKQDLRLIPGTGELGILLSYQGRKLGEELAVSVRQRIQEGGAERLHGYRVDDGRIADELAAAAPQDGTLSQPPPSKLRVIKDTRASANDRLVPIGGPGEAHCGLEVLVVAPSGTQVAAVKWS